MGKIARYLNQLIVGNVFDSPEILEKYSTDLSVLAIKPKLVALPESTEDVQRLTRFCYQLALKDVKAPITVRGSGLDETGADLGSGMIILTDKLNRLLEADKRERLVRVQAGITLKELNTALSLNGLTIPVAGHEMETIGGLISNLPSDDFAGKYGGIMNHVERIEVVLADGSILQTSRMGARTLKKKAAEKNPTSKIYNKIAKLAEKHDSLIKEMSKKPMGRAGYQTITKSVQKGSIDLMPLFFGAQGTLGIITEVILRAVPIESHVRRTVATFSDFKMAQNFLDMVAPMKPRKLNLYDVRIMKVAEETGKKLGKITGKLEDGFVVQAEFDHRANAALRKIESVRNVLPRNTFLVTENGKNSEDLDELDNSLVSFLNQTKNGERVPIVTNFTVPAKNLENFIQDIKVLEGSLGMELALYGSYMTNCYSLRPKFDTTEKDFSKKSVAFLRASSFIIRREGGKIAGGSAEGRIKALVSSEEMSDDETMLYADIKNAFDKYGILNPGVKLEVDPTFVVRHFRKN